MGLMGVKDLSGLGEAATIAAAVRSGGLLRGDVVTPTREPGVPAGNNGNGCTDFADVAQLLNHL